MNATTVAGSSSYTLVIAAGDLDSLTVAEAAIVRGAVNSANYSYSLSDTWATLSNAANAAIVTDASTYALSDIGNLTNATVAQANLLLNASNHTDETYSLTDSAANLALSGATGSGATNIAVTDAATVAQATAILALSNSGTTSYNLTDTWATLSNTANAATVGSATTYAISDIGNLTNATVAQAGVLLGASNYDSQSYSLSDTLEAVLGAEPGLLDGAASVELSGNVQVSADLSAITAPLLFAGDTIAVADGQTLTLTAEQADGVTIRGEGNVVVTELGEDPVNLSGIAVNGSQTAMVLGGSNYLYMDPDSDLGSLEVVVADDTDLSVTAAQANGMTIRSSGSGADNGLVHISDMVIGQAYDFSGISSGNGEVYTIIASGGTLNPDTKLGEMVIHVVYEADNTFTLTAAQADGRVIRCTESIGHIQITDMDVATQYDFAGIEASGASVSVVDTSGGPWRPTLD